MLNWSIAAPALLFLGGSVGAAIAWMVLPWFSDRRVPRHSDLINNLLHLISSHPQQLDQLLGSMNEALWVFDIERSELLFVSDSVLRIYGLSRDELQQQPLSLLRRLHPDDIDKVRAAWEGLLSGQSVDIEHRLLWETGDIFWVHVEAHRLRDRGDRRLVGGVSRDITAQRRLSEFWRVSEERYRRLVSMADTSIIVLDESLHVLEWNEAAERIFGLTRAEALGMNFLEHALRPQDRDAWYQAWASLREDADIFRLETEVIGAHGTVFWVSWNSRLCINPHNARRELVVVGMDVSELHRMTRDVARNERHFRAIFENSPTAMALVRDDGQLLRVNREYENFFATSAEQLLMRSAMERADHPGGRYLHEDLRRLEHGQESLQVLRVYRTTQGEVRWGNTWLRRHEVGEDGHVLYLELILDVTEQRRAEAALNERDRQLASMVSNLPGILYSYSCKLGQGLLVEAERYRLFNLHHDWRPSFISEGAQQITGFKAESFTRGDVFSLGHLILAEDRAQLIPQMERAINQGGSFELLYRIRGAASELRWISERGRAVVSHGQLMVEGLMLDVTSQKLAEESEQIYRQLVADTHTGFLAIDGNGLVRDANRPFLEFLGLQQIDRLLLHSIYEWTAPESRAATIAMITEVSTGAAVKDVELDYIAVDGRRVSLLLSAVATRSDHEVLIRGLLVDVSERRRQQRELEQSRNLLAESQRIAGLGFWVEDRTTATWFASEELCALLGWTRSTQPDKRELWLDEVHPDDRPQVKEQLRRGEDSCRPFSLEFRLRPGAQGVRFMRCSINVDLDAQGRVLRWVGVLQDVTAMRQAEQAILLSEQRYRSLFDSSIDGICILDLQGRIEETNPAFQSIVAYDAQDLRGMNEHDLTLLDDRSQDARILQQVLARGYGEIHRKTYRCRHGATVAVSVRQWLVRDSQHQPQRIMAMVRDISELEVIEAEKEQLQRAVQQAQKMEAIGHLTGGIAHDFNNILTSILGYADLSLRYFDADPAHRLTRYIRQIRSAGERARELIAQMLIFSRGGRSPGRVQPVQELILATLRMLRPALPSSLHLRTHIDADTPPILVDAVQLQQVVMNLVINARDALGASGEVAVALQQADIGATHCASCHARIEGNHVVIDVADKGPGIDPAIVSRIFDPFFTTKEVGRGSGMGLSVVHGIVHEFGGHILLESAPGRGARFRILFQAQSLEQSAPDLLAAEQQVFDARAEASGATILIVEDELAVAQMLAELLSLYHYRVQILQDPLQALEALSVEAMPFDLLIADQIMPGLLGHELIARVRALHPTLPILLCSAQADLLQRQQSLPNACALLSKPIEAEALLRVVQDLLRQARGGLPDLGADTV